MDGIASVNDKDYFKRIAAAVASIIIFLSSLFSFFSIQKKEYAFARGSSAIVMEISTNRVLYGSNVNARLPMASTTKVMTALIVVENCALNEVVTVPKKAVGVEGSSIYLKEGEKLTVKELLYGLMLRSGNDAAVTLAIHTAKSLDGFIDMMNEKAQSMGLVNTHFVNPHGLHDDNHYTSAYDLAFISAAAMRNRALSEIVGTKNITVGQGESVRFMHNKNRLLSAYNGATGVKTGFTKKAGRCFVGGSKRDGMELVCVVLNCGPMFEECMRLMDNAYKEYEMVKILDSRDIIAQIPVKQGVTGSAECALGEDIYIPMKKDGSERCAVNSVVPRSLEAPVKKGAITGKIEIFVNDCLLFSKNVYSIGDINKKGAGFWKRIFG